MTISFVFLLLAFICFIGAAVNPPWPRVNLIGLGLAFWVLTLLIHG
jgi:hypothetical protein